MGIGRCYNTVSKKPNDTEIKPDLFKICRYNSPNSFNHDYQQYLNYYYQITSLYQINYHENRTKLFIYNTESKTEEERLLDISNKLNDKTCIVQLPNKELFCFGNYPTSGITLIIDKNYSVRFLSSGTPCCYSSGIFFKNNVYCFGGNDDFHQLSLSMKFDLNENRWIDLTPMPCVGTVCNSIIFNGNILISSPFNSNILLYSLDLNSFSLIPYKFKEFPKKILINVERLYLIECMKKGFIYESEDEYSWKKFAKSRMDGIFRVYYSYNKRGIYISTLSALDGSRTYYNFNLSEKAMRILK